MIPSKTPKRNYREEGEHLLKDHLKGKEETETIDLYKV